MARRNKGRPIVSGHVDKAGRWHQYVTGYLDGKGFHPVAKKKRKKKGTSKRSNPAATGIKRGKLGTTYAAKGVRVRKQGKQLIVDLLR